LVRATVTQYITTAQLHIPFANPPRYVEHVRVHQRSTSRFDLQVRIHRSYVKAVSTELVSSAALHI